ncbi:MAG: SpoIIE family protein phosphatase [Candidatus Omnitrophica bacterium]|nr:SpoIIE family protein phosphatase [Candidatus Omnitrophota bacterium]
MPKFNLKKIKLPAKTFRYIIAVAIPLLVILASYFRAFEAFELATLDVRFKLRPQQKVTDKVVIIEVAEDSLNKIGQWPIDRKFHAALIDVLTAYDVQAIIFDVLFGQESNPESDSMLIDSLKNSRRVYLPVALRLSEKKGDELFPEASNIESEPLPGLLEVASGVGHINAITDIDGKRRRASPFIYLGDKVIPQISFLALCDYLKIPIEKLKVEKSRYIQIRPDIKIPIDYKGQMMINFAGRWGKAFKHYSFVDILTSYRDIANGEKPAVDLSELKGKICLVGLTAVGTHDLNPIPLQKAYPMVGLHANLINTILSNSFIVRASRSTNIILLILLSIAIGLVVFKLKPALSAPIAIGIFIGFNVIAFLLFAFFNVWIDLHYPLLLILAVYITCVFHQYITERHKRQLIEKELDIAQRIQKSFLKETAPEREGLDIAVLMTAAKSVGGDLYDFVEIDDKRQGLMVGDVSGKGVPAALFMAMTVSDFRFHAKTEEEPIKLVTKLNDQISTESTSGLFVTLTYMMIDTQAKTLSIVDAGHLPVVHARKDQETLLITATGGMALGIMDGVEFTKHEVRVSPGDVFVLYTDGVTEARNTKKEEYGEDRLKDVVTSCKDLTAKEITDKVYKEILKFRGRAPQHDDITIMVLKIK